MYFKFKVGNFTIAADRGFFVIATGKRVINWSTLDGWCYERMPKGVRLALG